MPGEVSRSYELPDDPFGNVLRCAFCGEPYPEGTPESKHRRLTEHIFKCPAHPLPVVIRQRNAWQKAAEFALSGNTTSQERLELVQAARSIRDWSPPSD